EASSWFGLLAPSSMPAEQVALLQRETAKALATPALKERLASQGAVASGMPSKDFAALITSETKKWAQVVKTSGAKVD
ncbi:MAG TPA: tripartite tricarboxylate transporter substrate-binding protein, partial [Roseateles sp.]|nr:tripartite tricarboxylate transporter substrate-binding protein [Roseateles sp.]